MTAPSRRAVLQGMGALGAIGASTLAMGRADAFAGGGYKALVCVFLKGGLDGHDTVIPYDRAGYDAWAGARPSLLARYAANPDGSTRTRDALTQIAPRALAGQDLGSRAFALPPEMDEIAGLFAAEKASLVANVGPLVEPLNAAQFGAGARAVPNKLFSHNDQQASWASLATSGEAYGWGAAFGEAADAGSANTRPEFTMVSVAGNDDFLSGAAGTAFEVGTSGLVTLDDFVRVQLLGNANGSAVARRGLEDFLRSSGRGTTNLFERDVIDVQRRALDANGAFEAAVTGDAVATPFPATRLGGQLKLVAETIAKRGVLGATRQVFYVAIGGFDTHSDQAGTLPALQREIAEALKAFYDATVEMKVAGGVTTFTASDFGRTLIANGDGTDHGWGGHQIVMGGAVNGRRLFGEMPPASPGHAQDSGRGRLIPTVSVEQMAAPMGRWFGLTDAAIKAAFPRLPGHGAELALL